MTSTLQIPAELQAPAPRRVARRPRRDETRWQRHRAAIRWAIVASFAIGLLVANVGELLSLMLAPLQQATIKSVRASETYTSKGKITHYSVTYWYHRPGQPAGAAPVEVSNDIDGDEYDALRHKHSVMIQVSRFGLPAIHRSVWRYIAVRCFRWFAAVGLTGLAYTLFRRELLWRRQVRRLVSEGRPVMGRITGSGVDKDAWTNDAYIVEYEFSPPDSALTSPYRASAPVRVRAYERTHVGQAVVVLYDPEHPSQNLAYDFCDYCVKG